MKKIALNHLLPADKSSIYIKSKSYQLYLGNGHKVRFRNETKAKAFLVEVNESLNFCLLRINKVYKDLFCHYRDVWFYLDNGKKAVAEDVMIRNMFDAIDKNFELMVTRSHFENGNNFVFKYLNHCLENLTEIASILQEIDLARHEYIDHRMVKVILVEIKSIKNDVNNLGFDKGTVKLKDGYPCLG